MGLLNPIVNYDSTIDESNGIFDLNVDRCGCGGVH
jgi:hypothetical protein